MNTSNPNSPKHNRTIYFGLDIPFLDHLGVVPESAQEGKVRISYTVKPEHTNSFGVAQGGVLMTLLDFAMGAPEPPQIITWAQLPLICLPVFCVPVWEK